MKSVRLAIVGTGGMANWHAENFKKIKNCKMVAACDVNLARAQAYGEKHGISTVYESVEDLLAGCEFDAVSIVTPDAYHMPVSLACLAAGKHVMCEKPLALSHGDAKKMVAAANKAGVVNMVNFSYRDWSSIQAVAALVKRGDIGDVRHVEASYLQAWLTSLVWGDWRTNPAWLWRLSKSHGSMGVLGDIGVHIVDFATYPVGPISEVSCRLKAFDKAPGNKVGEYKLDANDSAVMTVEFANGALGVIHTSRWVGGHSNRLYLKIAGTKGTVEIDSEKATDSYRICRGKGLDKGEWVDVKCKPTLSNYRKFIKAVLAGEGGEPDFARGAEVQKVLDACFASDAASKPVKLK